MFSQRMLTVCILLVVLWPTLVVSQQWIKGVFCTVLHGGWIGFKCWEEDSLRCRILVFQTRVLNCRRFPCTRYDSPVQNACVGFFDCPIQHVKITGMCAPNKLCCGTGGKAISPQNGQENSLFKMPFFGKKFATAPLKKIVQPFEIKTEAVKRTMESNYSNPEYQPPHTEFKLPLSPQDYVKDLPKTLEDPVMVEATIVSEYEKFIQEVEAINRQEIMEGRQPILIPSFEDFRDVGLGNKPTTFSTS